MIAAWVSATMKSFESSVVVVFFACVYSESPMSVHVVPPSLLDWSLRLRTVVPSVLNGSMLSDGLSVNWNVVSVHVG